jgi:hypothetical protein
LDQAIDAGSRSSIVGLNCRVTRGYRFTAEVWLVHTGKDIFDHSNRVSMSALGWFANLGLRHKSDMATLRQSDGKGHTPLISWTG